MEYDYVKCGNSAELLKTLEDDSIDCVITSPPYDNLREYNGYCFDFEAIANELYRVLKEGGVIVWIVNDSTISGSETLTSFRQALYFKDIGFNIHDTVIWNKGSCAFPDKNRYYQCFEYMFVISKGNPKTFNPIEDRKNIWSGSTVHGTERQSDGSVRIKQGLKVGRLVKDYGVRYNIWNNPPEMNNKTNHPAVFPIDLIKDHVISWTNPNDIVLDCFLGSGTTAIACKELSRHYIGFEISDKYFHIADERIRNTTTQMSFEGIL